MDAPSGEFRFTRLENVIFGPGSAAALGAELKRHGAERAMIVTGASLGASPLLKRVTDAARGRIAGVFKGASQHVPSRTVAAAVEHARALGADALVSFGGGSPIDTAKAAAMALIGGAQRTATIDADVHAGAAGNPGLPHIAISTTLSAGEFTPFGGVTDESTLKKGGVGDPRLMPKVVILDPELTRATPAWLWAGTGMRALDHAVEGAYSLRHQPLSDALSARAIAMLTAHLLPSLKSTGTDELAHRGECQLAAWFSIFGAMNTRFGISHALGHQIGPRWNVPHGYTSCITLPHVMRFMARVAPGRFGPIAEGFGLRFDEQRPDAAALECAERAQRFIARFEVPTRLRDVGVKREELGEIAGTVLEEVERARAVGAPVSRKDLIDLLEAAW